MKRVSSLLLLCAVPTLMTYAVPGAKKVKPWRLGVEGGLELSRFRASKELISPDNCMGWFVGPKLRVNIPLPNLGADVALLYTHNELEYVTTGNLNQKKLHTFVIPVNLRYNWTIESNFVLFMATGPQWNWSVNKSDLGTVGKLDHSYFDWNVGLGVEILKRVQMAINYNIPLGKMGEVNNVNLEGHTWNVRFAFYF